MDDDMAAFRKFLEGRSLIALPAFEFNRLVH